MAHANTEPRSESEQVGGHVLTRGCRYRPDLQRWEPVASVRPAWDPAQETTLFCPPEEFQDTPEDAFGVARRLLDTWLAEHPAGR
jgi:hypothetical protein